MKLENLAKVLLFITYGLLIISMIIMFSGCAVCLKCTYSINHIVPEDPPQCEEIEYGDREDVYEQLLEENDVKDTPKLIFPLLTF